MERIERIQLAIEKGYTYNSETGELFGMRGNVINNKSNGYIRTIMIHEKKYYNLFAHHLAWYIVHGEIVDCLDHINGDRSDNRICNLRSINNQQNCFNQTKGKGYSWFKRDNNWRAYINLNRKFIHLGYFNTEEDARNAYLKAKKQYHII